MKRLYYLLLAACAMFVLPQAARAELTVKLVGDYNGTWGVCTDAFTYKGDNTYTLDLTSNKDGKFYFRFNVEGWNGQMCPYTNGVDLMATSPYGVTYTDNGAYGDNSFYVTLVKGKTYTFTFKDGTSRTVSCVESSGGGSTDTDKEKVYLNGGYSDEEWVTSGAFTAQGNNIYTYEYTSTKAGDYWFKFKVDGWANDPCPNVDGYELSSAAYSFVYSNDYPNCAFKVTMEAGKTYVFTFASVAKTVSCALKSGDTPTPTPTIVDKEYTAGYYLVGNFFNTDGTTINYNNGVFKFRQNGVDADGNALYLVEIPASLTAHAQVMAVGTNGKPTGVYGPGTAANGVCYTNPVTGETISGTPTFSATVAEGENYWNMVTRNETSDNYTDGTYEITLTEDKTTGKITNWEIKHNALKRVAYFLSDAKDATALPLYASRSDANSDFSAKFFATINLSSNNSYYVVSNYLLNKQYVSLASAYGALAPNKITCPTTNKLFLMGNGGNVFETTGEHNEFSPNSLPMTAGVHSGSMVVEYNCSNGNNKTVESTASYLGMRGQVIVRDNRASLSSVSMIGTAVPGTLNTDNTWNFASTAGDMTYSENEHCYKLTLVTTAADGETAFRFVGNHNKAINWHEDGTADEQKAKTPYNSTDADVKGHVANAADPNYVYYTQTNENADKEEYHITWNRPAGRYTVRLYTVTTTSGNDPITKDYYTITANTDLELRDFEDVVYKSLDNPRKIENRGNYRYFRSWSSRRAFKRPENVEVFVVTSVANTEDNTVTYSLKNINKWNGTDDVIPANTGVILAMKADAEPNEAQLQSRKSLTSYNTLVIPMELYADNEALAYTDANLLHTCFEAQTIPTYNSTTGEYNYLFGFYQANRGLGVTTYPENEFLLGFWISGGTGAFYNNSAYLPIAKAQAEKLGLGTSQNDFNTTTGAKKAPALLFDFESLGDGGNGEVTGIKNVAPATDVANDNNYYTLGGQRISKPLSRGIYIHNGKKYIVK